jgi:hypothetical protein
MSLTQNLAGAPSKHPIAYIGCKIITAYPCTLYEWNEIKGRPSESENSDGYLVNYPDGYMSWSPKHTFEEAYRPISENEKHMIK